MQIPDDVEWRENNTLKRKERNAKSIEVMFKKEKKNRNAILRAGKKSKGRNKYKV